ncbi:MAG TPA: hypothetical protein VJV23_05170, partial [Candidatus Polarisedimenticolia bacterium]|nr:hypothetical protein [Candidatus Polarisedimenticolia bacterium]
PDAMTRSHRPSRRMLAAILVACYGMLAWIATAPHPHAMPDSQRLRTAGPAWIGEGAADSGTAAHPGHGACPLCAWSRTGCRPALASASGAPPAAALRPAPHHEPLVPLPAQSRPAQLRAPPAAV